MDFSGSFDHKMLVFGFVDVQILLSNRLSVGAEQVEDLFVVDLQITDLDFKLSGLGGQRVVADA